MANAMTDEVFFSISNKPLMLVNFDLTQIVDYCDVLDTAHGNKREYRYRSRF